MDAQETGDELERIREENGGQLRPEGVVDAARDPQSLLHPCFEWDDAVAGEKYRREQASNLIRSIRVLLIRSDENGEEKLPVRAFINVIPEGSDTRVYLPRALVASTPTLYNQAVNDAISYLRAAEVRLAEFRDMRKDVERIRQVRLKLETRSDEAHP